MRQERMRSPGLCQLLTLLSLLASPVAGAAGSGTLLWLLDLGHESNPLNALGEGWRRDDQSITLSTSYEQPLMVSENSVLQLGIAGEWRDYRELQSLDNASLLLNATYRTRSGTAFNAPWFSASLQGMVTRHPADQLRDRDSMMFELAGGLRLTDRLSARLDWRWQRSAAEQAGWRYMMGDGSWSTSAPLYDLASRSLQLSLDWTLPPFTSYLRLGIEQGDRVSSGGRIGWQWSRAWAADPAVGPGWWAYRYQATTRPAEIGLNFAINRGKALDLSLRLVESDAGGGRGYRSHSIHLGYLHRFE